MTTATTTITDYGALLAALDIINERDDVLLSAIADVAEEDGRDDAAGWRWLVANRRWPQSKRNGHIWHRGGEAGNRGRGSKALPPAVYARLPGEVKRYETLSEAMSVVAIAAAAMAIVK